LGRRKHPWGYHDHSSSTCQPGAGGAAEAGNFEASVRGQVGVNTGSQRHHRRSIRLKGYDNTQPGAYFVTMVTW